VAEYFFDLRQDDRREALEYVRAETGRPTHLLEKDLWVVWIFSSDNVRFRAIIWRGRQFGTVNKRALSWRRIGRMTCALQVPRRSRNRRSFHITISRHMCRLLVMWADVE
jgi:hypothetical protein